MNDIYLELLNEFKNLGHENIVVAVSGGADSISLLHLLVQIKKQCNINIICAHVNHNVRKESETEKDFVNDFCLKNDVIFEYMKIGNYNNDNFHNQARIKRYEFFESLLKKYNSKYLFTAHHGDDLIETILMKIVRGASFKGYSGFSKKAYKQNYIVYRPFITVTKDQIYKYVKDNKLSFVEDQSNFKDIYTRNRFRKYVLPMLKNENRNVHTKFYKFSKCIFEYNEYIENEAKRVIDEIIVDDVLNITKFVELNKIISEKIIYMYLEKKYQDDLVLISDKHVELIYNIITSTKPNSFVYLPNSFKAVKSYTKFYIEKNNASTAYNIELSEKVLLPNGKTIEVVDNCDSDGNDICRLDFSSVKLPLKVRSRKKGDKILVKGMCGSKKIKDIFIDSKITPYKRESWPIVVDSDDVVLWIPGLKKSKFNSKKQEKCDIILKYY